MKKVVAVLKKKYGVNYWVIRCPHCGRNHRFKAGDYTMNPVDFLGQRKTSCGKKIIIESKCRVCGCTDSNACPGGCHWVKPDLCSRCAQN